MKTVKVVAAIIYQNHQIFATARGYGDYKGQWEFPGGKVEEHESNEEALIREIKEELNTIIEVKDYLTTVEYDYPNFHLSMACYFCSVKEGTLQLLEASDSRWLSEDQLYEVQWLPADLTIIEKVKEKLQKM